MILNPDSLREFYGFLRHVALVEGLGFKVEVDKSQVFTKDMANNYYYADKRRDLYHDFYGDMVILDNRDRRLTNILATPIKEKLTTDLKKYGMAKVSATTRYDIVLGETKKNTMFACTDLHRIAQFLTHNNEKLSKANQELNKPVLAYLEELVVARLFENHIHWTTASKVGGLRTEYRFRLGTIANGAEQQDSIMLNISPFKYKFSFHGFESRNIDRLSSFINVAYKYVEAKEKSKELFFHNRDNKISLFDILFMPAEAAIEAYNSNPEARNYYNRLPVITKMI